MRSRFFERLLRVFGDVRPGEAGRLLLLFSNLMLLMLLYYLLKTVREPLILSAPGGGAEVKSYAAAAQAVLLLGVAGAFGWLGSRVGRMVLLGSVILFFASNLVLFVVLFLAFPHAQLQLGVAFFIWVGCFNVMIVAQFWAFANDLHGRTQGERLFGVIAGGSAIGAVLGARLAKPLYALLGPLPVLLGCALLLLGCLVLTFLAHRQAPLPRRERVDVLGSTSGLALLFRDRYLLFVAALSLVKNWVNTTGEYILDRRLLEVATQRFGTDVAASGAYIAAFKSDYFTYVNAAVLALQLFAVSRVMRYLGVSRSLMVLPLLALSGYATMALVPVLGVIFFVKIAENSTNYSLQKTVEQVLYLDTSREAKYKAKAFADTFAVRAGDVLSAGLVWCGARMGLATMHFIVAAVLLTVVWIGVVVGLSRLRDERPAEVSDELLPSSASGRAAVV